MFVALVVVGFVAGYACAGLVLDVTALGGSSNYDVSPDGKTVTLKGTGGYDVNFKLRAIIEDANDLFTDDSLTTVFGGIKESNINTAVAAGKLQLQDSGSAGPYHAKGGLAPFDQSAGTPTVTDTLLGLENSTSTSSMVWTAGTTPQNGNDTNLDHWDLGVFQFHVASLGGAQGNAATVNYVKAGKGVATYTFKIDTSVKNGNTGYDLVTVGGDVTLKCVPEPSTLILLGMAGLALLAIRRK